MDIEPERLTANADVSWRCLYAGLPTTVRIADADQNSLRLRHDFTHILCGVRLVDPSVPLPTPSVSIVLKTKKRPGICAPGLSFFLVRISDLVRKSGPRMP
jgi:hypothetical protein